MDTSCSQSNRIPYADLEDEVDILTIGLAVVATLLVLIVIALIIYKIVLYRRQKQAKRRDIDHDMTRKPRPSRQFHRPKSLLTASRASNGEGGDTLSLELTAYNSNMMSSFLGAENPVQPSDDASKSSANTVVADDGAKPSEGNGVAGDATKSRADSDVNSVPGGENGDGPPVGEDSKDGKHSPSHLVEIDLENHD
ncbi:hypothetical protein PoB_007040200 [Plakobranchus ocellatus]|uniref:Uncharacterized protein n=1 Tax=Plakobranchus ocellatus TaxID=259542 RepID=A0AAV4DIP1_9GAST|nr:hypothetical protein PoB_007040200 [Plakobranchus ocellatus]